MVVFGEFRIELINCVCFFGVFLRPQKPEVISAGKSLAGRRSYRKHLIIPKGLRH
jgi:hypothetical protein